MFSKINAWLHLWLGLASGIVVFILSITGCLLVFQQELSDLFHPWRTVRPRTSEEQFPPSVIFKAVKEFVPGLEINSAWYEGLDKSVKINLNSDSVLYVNPYTAEMLALVDHEVFFHFIDEGHRHLWLPQNIGRRIVGWSTFIFFVLLLTGLILWWPKKWTRSSREKSFRIKWKAGFKRVNYDLHNVLGFYSLIFALVIAISGLVMSFTWARSSVYWIMRANYGIHTGLVLGMPTKILYFLASLISASLPFTGLLVWLGKKKKKPGKRRNSAARIPIPGRA